MTLISQADYFIGIVKAFLNARSRVDTVKEELKQAQDELEVAKIALVNSKEFTEKSITVDGNTITKRVTTTQKLKEGAEIPEEYYVEVFDYNAMIKGEPKQWERLVKQYMIDYPEYKIKKLDDDKLKKDKPDLFIEEVTTTLVLSKPKESVTESGQQQEPVYAPSDDLPF